MVALILEVWRGTRLAVENATMISPEPWAAKESNPANPQRGARLLRRTSCEESSGASVATMVMIEPGGVRSRRGSREFGLQHLADRRAVERAATGITPKFDCTSTPTV